KDHTIVTSWRTPLETTKSYGYTTGASAVPPTYTWHTALLGFAGGPMYSHVSMRTPIRTHFVTAHFAVGGAAPVQPTNIIAAPAINEIPFFAIWFLLLLACLMSPCPVELPLRRRLRHRRGRRAQRDQTGAHLSHDRLHDRPIGVRILAPFERESKC